MNSRGLRAFLVATAAFAAVVWTIGRIGTNQWDILGYGIFLGLVWSSLRLITISIRRFHWLLSLGCAIAFFLEVKSIADYGSFVYPEAFQPRTDLQFLQTMAICALVFGRVLDFYILKPYFPREARRLVGE